MCVGNKQFELLEFVFNYVYVDMKYNEISPTFTAGYVCLCVVIWSIYEIVSVPYVDDVNMMRVLLFVLHVSMVRVTAMLVWGTGEVWLW